MKYKIPLVILVALLTGFLFTGQVDSLQMWQDSRLQTFPLAVVSPDKNMHEITYQYLLNDPSTSRLPDPALIDYLSELSASDDVSIIISASDFDETEYIRTYFVTGNIFQLDPMIGDTLNWDDSSVEQFVSSDHPEHPIHRFHSKYSQNEVIFRPWHQLYQHFESFWGRYQVHIYTQNNPQKYADLPQMFQFKDKAEVMVVSNASSDFDINQGGYFQSHSSAVVIAVTSLLIVFLYILFVFDHGKEIAVRKLSGQGVLKIFLDLLLKLNLLISLTFLLSSILLALSLRTGWNPFSFVLYRQMALVGLLFVGGLVLASLISLFYIYRVDYSSLKSTGKQPQTTILMHIVKALVLILAISFIASFIDNSRAYRYNKEYLTTFGTESFYTVLLTPEARHHDIYYDDLHQAMSDDMVFAETIQVADISTVQENQPIEFLYQTVIANQKITEYADIRLADGTIFSPEPGKKYLLHPEGMDIEGYFQQPQIRQRPDGVEYLILHPDQHILLPHEHGGPYDYYRDFSFFISDEITSQRYDHFLIDRRQNSWDDFSRHLQSQGLVRESFFPLPSGFSQSVRILYHVQVAERNLIVIGYFVLIAVLIIYSFNRIYVDDHRKRLAVSYLFGEPYWRRYLTLIGAILLTYGLLGLFFTILPNLAQAIMRLNYSAEMGALSYDLSRIGQLIGLTLALDMVLSLVFTHRLERGVIRALKGGEL